MYIYIYTYMYTYKYTHTYSIQPGVLKHVHKAVILEDLRHTNLCQNSGSARLWFLLALNNASLLGYAMLISTVGGPYSMHSMDDVILEFVSVLFCVCLTLGYVKIQWFIITFPIRWSNIHIFGATSTFSDGPTCHSFGYIPHQCPQYPQ